MKRSASRGVDTFRVIKIVGLGGGCGQWLGVLPFRDELE